MTASPYPSAKWIGLDAPPAGGDAAPGEATIDRLHNQANPSPEAVAEMLRELQDSLTALDERLTGVETAEGQSAGAARRLGLEVAHMGRALAHRVRAMEKNLAEASPAVPAPAILPPPKRPPEKTLWLSLALAAALAAVLAGFWLREAQSSVPAAKTPAKTVVPLTPTAPPPSLAPAPVAAVTVKPAPAKAVHPAWRRGAKYRPAPRRASPGPVAPAVAPTTGFRSYGQVPAPAPAPAPPLKPPA